MRKLSNSTLNLGKINRLSDGSAWTGTQALWLRIGTLSHRAKMSLIWCIHKKAGDEPRVQGLYSCHCLSGQPLFRRNPVLMMHSLISLVFLYYLYTLPHYCKLLEGKANNLLSLTSLSPAPNNQEIVF